MNLRLVKWAPLLLLPFMVSACSTFKSPTAVQASAQTINPPSTFALPAQANGAAPVAAWWAQFNDPQLDQLVVQALAHNHSIRIAEASLAESRAYLRNSKFDRYPTVEASATGIRQRQSADVLGNSAAANSGANSARISEVYSEGFDASWELDLFGRVRNGVRLSRAQAETSQADLDAARVSIAAEVASAYINMRGGQYLLSVAEQNVGIQWQSLKLAQRFADVGRGDQLDVARATAQLELTRASLPSFTAQINAQLNRLGVLTGNSLPTLKTELAIARPLPSLPATFAVGDPRSLLQRRPDIRRAEQTLAAAVAQYNIRVADLYPSISFTGGLGFLSNDWDRLGDSNTSTFLFSPRIHWAAFNLGRVQTQIDAADARTQARIAEFEQRVLVALEETDNSLQNFAREEERRAGLLHAVKASTQAAVLASKKFEIGSSDFLAVLDAQRAQLNVSAQLAQSDVQVLLNLIAIYKSLGGGWSEEATAQELAEVKRLISAVP